MALIPIYWWNKEVRNFKISQDSFRKQPWANGVILLACVALAMLLANLPFTKEIYHNFLHTELTIHIASPDGFIDWFLPRDMTMEKFINDILMVIFFFTVGLEIKREVVCGELSSFKKAILPVIAAFGGVVMPAVIFALVNHGTEASSGWGIPTATDIAFAVGILSILGDRVPVSLKVFLTALAIADDLIAILVVALFYGGNINLPLLAVAVVVIMFVALMKKLGEKRIGYYMIPAIIVWFLFYYSGIHATMTGVVIAMLIPMDARYNQAKFHRRSKILWDGLLEAEQHVHTAEDFPNGPERYYLRRLSSLTKKTIPPSYRLEHKLNPIVNFAIMPIFAISFAEYLFPLLRFSVMLCYFLLLYLYLYRLAFPRGLFIHLQDRFHGQVVHIHRLVPMDPLTLLLRERLEHTQASLRHRIPRIADLQTADAVFQRPDHAAVRDDDYILCVVVSQYIPESRLHAVLHIVETFRTTHLEGEDVFASAFILLRILLCDFPDRPAVPAAETDFPQSRIAFDPDRSARQFRQLRIGFVDRVRNDIRRLHSSDQIAGIDPLDGRHRLLAELVHAEQLRFDIFRHELYDFLSGRLRLGTAFL